MPDKLSEEEFRKHLGAKFRVRFEAEGAPEIDLLLEELTPFPMLKDSRGEVERFSLYFKGPGDLFLQQGTYRLEREGMGELDIFLVPVGRDESGFRYEAVFNLFKNK
jgi:hypothetical protein